VIIFTPLIFLKIRKLFILRISKKRLISHNKLPISSIVATKADNNRRGIMSYFARGLRDLLKKTQLNEEFFEGLDSFQKNFIDMCFKQSLDQKMGMMGDVESYNFHLFQEFQLREFEIQFGLQDNYLKKVA
jgi:hypothetical protein